MNDDQRRLTDDEREYALVQLREACVDGRLTLNEFSERVETALTARTQGDLVPVTSDLVAALPPPRRTAQSRMIAVMGDSKQSGRWRIAEENTAIAVMGDCELDLRRAEVEGDEVHITAYAIMGDVRVIVPEGVPVELNGMAIMGDKKLELEDVRQLPGAPLIRVHAYAVMGDVRVESRR